jgi:hypothetical protein
MLSVVFFIVMLKVIVLSVVMLNVVMLSVAWSQVLLLCELVFKLGKLRDCKSATTVTITTLSIMGFIERLWYLAKLLMLW